MDIHNRHADIVGTVMFYGVMSGAHSAANQDINPEKAVQISEHIVRRLKEHDGSDPARPPIRIFLEKFGASRMDDLERSLTGFIGLAADARLAGVPFAGPARHLSAEVLFRCKDVVENNAARLKGWGAMHDRVDTQLILFQECARRLEAMQREDDP
ncbi:hypothetical protein GTA08_BOTSDO02017 [Neofusicoccum parvum]|uniref:Uncharacterized protein n=1 Tax=Neofusicoccum parvum TaxID=310453 RepID=A0ACB5SPH7_9PEZI|nr:hypothetical protein GTA08_BOTSDO02017 [Neofusicoccum parvum]GME64619.1 hypothetical protein GTA08_BOTSDO02017 [Neofusicoccum parvum]